MDDAKDAHKSRLMYKAYMTANARKSDKVRRYFGRFYSVIVLSQAAVNFFMP